MAGEVISVFLIDDQPVFRLGLRHALERAGSITVLGETSMGEEAVELVCSFQPGVVLLGAIPTRYRALDLCRRIGQRCPGTPIIVMTSSDDTGELFEAIRSGAWGYLSKLASPEEIVRAIQKAYQGEMPVLDIVAANPDVGRRILEEFQVMARNPRLRGVMAPLSHRELELLQQLGQGRSNKEIAHILSITPRTVKNHITSILRKLDVNDRTQAVLAGLRFGWITLGGDSGPSEEADLPASNFR